MLWIMGALPFALLILGFPIFLILLATCAVTLTFFSSVPATIAHQIMFDTVSKYALLAVPFFIFAGELMTRGGLSGRLLKWIDSMVGGFRGSLPLTSLGMAAVFGSISGATTAAVAAVGTMTYPRMRKAGYGEGFASALITAEGALDNLIPPSIGMILYGVASDTSISDLFAAGVFPGLLLAAFFAGYILYYSARHTAKESRERLSVARFISASRQGVWAILAPVVILGGIYSGLFSPTEAAGVACVYAIFVAMAVYREIGLRELFDIAARSMYLTALVFIIVAAAGLYAWLLTISGVAQSGTALISSLQMPPWAVLLCINVLLLAVGCFLDPGSAILILTPLLLPIAKGIGINPVHFGVIVVMNLTIGTFHPPFGLNIFVCQAIFKVRSAVLYAGLMPFVGLAVAALMVVTYVPALSLWILRFLH
ncbi:MAG TPA: TRAP transporter large permease [Xanthobacteraceae bacterium]|jgi:C4-dicarboxylate transporter DctM subunit|nr:TRAP transporter large permease [Xanthobacteraceae bacterium]